MNGQRRIGKIGIIKKLKTCTVLYKAPIVGQKGKENSSKFIYYYFQYLLIIYILRNFYLLYGTKHHSPYAKNYCVANVAKLCSNECEWVIKTKVFCIPKRMLHLLLLVFDKKNHYISHFAK